MYVLCGGLFEFSTSQFESRKLVLVQLAVEIVSQEAVSGLGCVQVGHLAPLPDSTDPSFVKLLDIILQNHLQVLFRLREVVLADAGRETLAVDHGLPTAVTEFFDLDDVRLVVALGEQLLDGLIPDHGANGLDFVFERAIFLLVGLQFVSTYVEERGDLDVPGDADVEWDRRVRSQEVGRVLHLRLGVLVVLRRL